MVVREVEKGEDGLKVSKPVETEVVDGEFEHLQEHEHLAYDLNGAEGDFVDLDASREQGQDLVADHVRFELFFVLFLLHLGGI